MAAGFEVSILTLRRALADWQWAGNPVFDGIRPWRGEAFEIYMEAAMA
jgi:hypothetical protein